MATVAGLGIGLIILAVVWVLCIFTCIALTRAQGAIAYSGVAAVLVALLLTIILWFFPRGPESATQDYIIYDGYFIPRYNIGQIRVIIATIKSANPSVKSPPVINPTIYINKDIAIL